MPDVSRVDVTGEAAELLRRLTEAHGPVMFHQSGGCCDGSAPMCYPDGDFMLGDADVHLGRVSQLSAVASVVLRSASQGGGGRRCASIDD